MHQKTVPMVPRTLAATGIRSDSDCSDIFGLSMMCICICIVLSLLLGLYSSGNKSKSRCPFIYDIYDIPPVRDRVIDLLVDSMTTAGSGD